MANKKRKQRNTDHAKIMADAKRYNIRYGDYNGATSSDDFMVMGHSSGSPYSEMEELSEQVTRDAGGLPYREVEFANDQADTAYESYQGPGVGDLGGPEFYGNKPSLLKKSPIHHAGTSRGLAIAAGIGLAATAVLGGLSYFFYQTSQAPAKARKSASRGTSAATTATGAGKSKSASTKTAKAPKARATKSRATKARSTRSASINA